MILNDLQTTEIDATLVVIRNDRQTTEIDSSNVCTFNVVNRRKCPLRMQIANYTGMTQRRKPEQLLPELNHTCSFLFVATKSKNDGSMSRLLPHLALCKFVDKNRPSKLR